MKVSYEEELAIHFGLQRRGGSGNGIVLSVRAKGNAGQPLSSEITTFACRSRPDLEKATSLVPLYGEARVDAAESENLCMRGHSKRENREILFVPRAKPIAVPSEDGQRTSPRALLT